MIGDLTYVRGSTLPVLLKIEERGGRECVNPFVLNFLLNEILHRTSCVRPQPHDHLINLYTKSLCQRFMGTTLRLSVLPETRISVPDKGLRCDSDGVM